jgi:hypothetical protein
MIDDMALLYQAELSPTKLQLVGGWAPSQPWFVGDAVGGLVLVGSYRFDDPEGEVGIETLLVRAGGGPVLQVPLTYRAAPLESARDWLIGTMQHSVLGERWTYDATGDPVYLAALATTMLSGTTQVEQWIEIDGVMVERQPTARVRGDGADAAASLDAPVSVSTQSDESATYIDTETHRIVIARVLGDPLERAGEQSDQAVTTLEQADEQSGQLPATLTGNWTDHPESTVLATVTSL